MWGYNPTVNTVVVFDALTEFDAQTIVDLLRENSIPALVRTNIIAGIDLGFVQGVNPGWGTVSVPEEHVEKALELIAGFRGSLGMLEEFEGEAEEFEDEESE